MIKKKIAAAFMAIVTAAAASACGAKNNTIQNPNSPPERDSSSLGNAAEGKPQGAEDTNTGEGSAEPASDSGSADVGAAPGAIYIKRAEEASYPTSGKDVKKPPEGGKQLTLLISMDPVTNYVHAAETYLSMGGKIKVIKTPKEALFDQISSETVAGKHIDIAQFDNGMMYPCGVVQQMIQPVDMAIDFSAKRWEQYRDLSDAFALNNWHYVAAFGCNAKYALYYNKKLFSANGFEDPLELYKKSKWNTESLCGLLRSWKSLGGRCGIAGHDIEQCLSMGSGHTLISYDVSCGGFSSRVYDPDICVVMNYIYGLKDDGLIGGLDAYDAASAFRGGALFWSGTYAEGAEYSDPENLGVIPYPTLTGAKNARCFNAEYDGLVLLKNSKSYNEARAFFECVRDEEHAYTGSIAKFFKANGTPVYEYGMGITPRLSDSGSGANQGFSKAVIPLMYTEGPAIGDWDDRVCFGLSPAINEDLTNLNNAIADLVYGRSKAKESKPAKADG